MVQEAGRDGGLDQRAVLLAAGLADLAVSTLGTALGTVRGLLRRSDAAELAADAEHDLMARGRLALDRYTAVPPAHLEILARHARHARHARSRQAAADDV
ncbi:polyprenyl synthetase [Streptomyces sp. NPDC059866]|uniref:polyprenyl synthetase n=1 Tax=Streptomyces sp. NPDC059866 TaxID=3346978 RepID=UPI00365A2A62